MTTRGILIVAGLFLGMFVILFLGKCGYGRLEIYQSIDSLVAHVRREFPEVAPIDAATLRLYLEQGPSPLLIDIRGEEEYAMSHLPEAVSLPSAEAIADHLEGLEPPPTTLILYGSVGLRSAGIARKLSDDFPGRVLHLEGGIFRWANEGGELVDGSGDSATRVHPFNPVWGRLLEEERRGQPEPNGGKIDGP